jgi:hypothetical protein
MNKFRKSSNIRNVEKVVYVDWRPTDDADPREYRIEAVRNTDGTYDTRVLEMVEATIQHDGKQEPVLMWVAAKGMPWTNRRSADAAIEQLLSLIDD